MNNIKQIDLQKTADYTMTVYEITYPWGKVKSAHFVRPNNVFGSLSLKTVVNRWHNAEGKFRSTKQYQIIDDGKIIASLWADVRFNSEKGTEYINNQEAVRNFFYMFSLQKQIHALKSAPKAQA